jgi:Flp pilus assembly protein TadG
MKIGRVKRKARAGSVALETAIVIPLVTLSIIFPTIELSQYGMLTQQMNAAAREGCRTAVLEDSSQSAVAERVSQVMGTQKDGQALPVSTTVTPTTWTVAPKGTAIKVSLSLPFDSVCWFGKPLLLSGKTLTASATMSSER